jgi:hypothetical protein
MNNYINIVLKRGYPFGFKSKYSYMKFIKKIETHILELYKGYKIEVKIQGSSIRKNNPKDIDVGIIVKEEDFIKIVEKSFKKPTEGTAKYRGMLHALEKGKITSNYADLSKFRRDIESVYGEIDLSIIKKNGEFDIKP